MINLAWTIRELSERNGNGRKLTRQIKNVVEKLGNSSVDLVKENVARQLTAIRDGLSVFILRVTHQKRTAATHIILVFLVSPEEWNKKHYPCQSSVSPTPASLSDTKARQLANKVIRAIWLRET